MPAINGILSGSDKIEQVISEGERFFVGRLGSVEAEILYNRQRINAASSELFESKKNGLRLRKDAWVSAGIWPPSNFQIEMFSDFYIDAIQNVTLMGSWGSTALKYEKKVLDTYCGSTPTIPLGSLDPILVCAMYGKAWTRALEGMNVLVISSFANEIIQQYQKFPLHTEVILPNFNLRTIKPPQTNGLTISMSTWTRNLKMFNELVFSEIEKHNTQLVLVAAGSYGLPVSNSIFQKGVSVIYVGGALQLIFGIWGSRWEQSKEVYKMANKNWVWPSKTTKPYGSFLIEKSCYW